MNMNIGDTIQSWESFLCQYLKFPNFDSFIQYLLSISNISKCQEAWSVPQISFDCKECSHDDSNCICLKCYLNSNHDGHSIFIDTTLIGNCDCGDQYQWKSSCQLHKPQQGNEIPFPISELLPKIFDIASAQLLNLINNEPSKAIQLLKWLLRFCEIGDKYRNLIISSMSKNEIFGGIIDSYLQSSKDVISVINDLLQHFVNDIQFKVDFGYVYLNKIFDIYKHVYDIRVKQRKNKIYSLVDLHFQFFKQYAMIEINKKYNFDFCHHLLNDMKAYQKYQLSFSLDPNLRSKGIVLRQLSTKSHDKMKITL